MWENSLETKTEICRLCLSYTKVYIYVNQNEKLCQMLKFLTAIEIHPEDHTSIMCYKCRLNLNLAYLIQQNMLKAEEKFQQQLSPVIEEKIDPERCGIFPEIEELKQMCSSGAVKVDLHSPPPITQEVDHPTKPNSSEPYCKICDKYYSSNSKLLAHRRQLHTTVKCPECNIDVKSGRIQTHVKRCHPGCKIPKIVVYRKQYAKLPEAFCKICNRYYISKNKLLVHRKLVHTTMKCTQCGLDMKTGKIQRHVKKFHPGCEIPKIIVEPKVRVYEKKADTYCKICDRYYINRNKLQTHKKLFHTTLKCKFCDKEILTGKIQSHFKKLHPGCEVPKRVSERKLYKKQPDAYCKKCDKYYKNRAKLIAHERMIHTTTKCYVCGLDVMTGRIQRHVQKIHPGYDIPRELAPKNHQCETCLKIFVKKASLVMHMRTHIDKVCCPKCPSVLRSYNLQKHMEQYHSGARSETPTQPKKVKSTNSKTRKNETIKSEPLTCTVCNRVFDTKTLLSKHMHNHERSDCPICGKSITTVNLHQHMNTHTTTGQQICELCGAILKNKGSLKVHMRQTHQEPQYKCNFCDKHFKRKVARNHHEIKEHLRQANYICDTCGKKFYTKSYLKKHVDMKHLNLRPFICEVCKNSYSSQFALTTHMRIHTNETPYKCDCCGDGFRQKVSLKNHLKSKHNIKEELTVFCQDCGMGFASDVALYSHRRVHQ